MKRTAKSLWLCSIATCSLASMGAQVAAQEPGGERTQPRAGTKSQRPAGASSAPRTVSPFTRGALSNKLRDRATTPPRTDSIRLKKSRIHVLPANLLETIDRQPNLRTFARLIRAAKLEYPFTEARITAFAPEDAAFARLAPGVLDGLLRPENREKLISFVNYCWVPSHRYFTDPAGRANAEALPGDEIVVRTENRIALRRPDGVRLWLEGSDHKRAAVIREDIDGINGSLFITNNVLFPVSVRID